MPMFQSGYHSNPAVGKMHDSMMSQDAPPADAAQPQSVTITNNGDGTFSCDDGSGNPSQHASFQEAADFAGQTLGAEPDMDDAQAMPPDPSAAPADNGAM